MISYIHPSPFAGASLHFLIALVLSGEKPPCGAEPRIELWPAFLENYPFWLSNRIKIVTIFKNFFSNQDFFSTKLLQVCIE
jgi:hypothetical protein